MSNQEYNGHKNYQTWNVSLWINNDEFLYDLARVSKDYKAFTDMLREVYQVTSTKDEVAFNDRDLDFDILNELIQDIN